MKKIILILLSLLFISCFGLFDSGTRDLINGYKLTWIDLPQENQFIVNKDNQEVISSHIYSVGFNNDYILIKQHPKIGNNKIDINRTNFFIISLKNDSIIGPLNYINFKKFRIKNKIKNIKFTLND